MTAHWAGAHTQWNLTGSGGGGSGSGVTDGVHDNIVVCWETNTMGWNDEGAQSTHMGLLSLPKPPPAGCD